VRIAISGSHCSGKTTLVEDFLQRHPEYAHGPEPCEWLAETSAELSSADAWQQLEISVERLSAYGPGSNLIAERSPIDFLAYLEALRTLEREDTSRMLDGARERVSRGMKHVDLLVILPLSDEIEAPEDEDPELRDAMNHSLLDIIADDLTDLAPNVRCIEIAGNASQRIVALDAEVRVDR